MPLRDRVENLASSLKRRLGRYGLQPIDNETEDDTADGWWAEVARWRQGRPSVGVWGGYIQNVQVIGAEPQYWFGFWSQTDRVKQLLGRLADQHGSERFGDADLDSSGKFDHGATGRLINANNANKPVYEDYDDDWAYFGMYDVIMQPGPNHLNEIVARAGSFIADIVAQEDGSTEENDIRELKNREGLTSTERETLILARRGQGRFRADLQNIWGGCAVTRCAVKEVLRASHIKPWRNSDDRERLDKHNGLLLVATLDSLFDRSLISFADDGKVLISPALSKEDRQLLAVEGIELSRPLNDEQRRYLRIHREEAGF